MTSGRKSETAMKALKPIIASLTLLFAVPVCIAGNPFVPSEKGTALTYVNRDRKGNIVGRSVQTVTDIAETAEGTVITINDRTLDADGKPLTADTSAMSDITVRIRISGDKVIFPMENIDQLIAEIKKSILGNDDIDFTVAMDEICYPLHPQVGQHQRPQHNRPGNGNRPGRYFRLLDSERDGGDENPHRDGNDHPIRHVVCRGYRRSKVADP